MLHQKLILQKNTSHFGFNAINEIVEDWKMGEERINVEDYAENQGNSTTNFMFLDNKIHKNKNTKILKMNSKEQYEIMMNGSIH